MEIDIQNVSMTYSNGKQALQHLNLSLKTPSLIGLLGPNGAGKSTLCRTITGLYRSMGTVQIDGEYLKRKRRTKKSFFVQQGADYQLYAPTVEDEFLIGRKASPELRQAALARLCEMGLEPFADRHPASLSGGQKQRIAVARALIRSKPILILDEGTSAIDRQTAHDIENRLLKLQDLTLITVTHHLDEDLLKKYDKILYMENGYIKEEGAFESLISVPSRFAAYFQLKK